jgi:hypothetical protein
MYEKLIEQAPLAYHGGKQGSEFSGVLPIYRLHD